MENVIGCLGSNHTALVTKYIWCLFQFYWLFKAKEYRPSSKVGLSLSASHLAILILIFQEEFYTNMPINFGGYIWNKGVEREGYKSVTWKRTSILFYFCTIWCFHILFLTKSLDIFKYSKWQNFPYGLPREIILKNAFLPVALHIFIYSVFNWKSLLNSLDGIVLNTE